MRDDSTPMPRPPDHPEDAAAHEHDPVLRLPWPLHRWHHDLSPRRVVATLTVLAVVSTTALCQLAYWLLGVGPGSTRETLAYYGLPLLAPAIISPLLIHFAWRFTDALRTSHENLRQEIWRRHQAEARLQELATTDDLTKLANRRAFFERAEELAAEAAGRHSVVIVDIDHFKLLNDRYGHPTGDRALQQFGAMLREHARPGTIVARLGGEEFGIIVPQTGADGGAAMCERLRVAASRLEIALTASFGVTAWPAGGEPFEAALGRADAALYRAKESGRDRTEVFESGMARTS